MTIDLAVIDYSLAITHDMRSFDDLPTIPTYFSRS
jgi:hypothetical protein